MEIEIKDIETERLLLRKYKISDLKDFIEHKDNEALYTFLPGKPKDKISGYKKSLKALIKESKVFSKPRWIWAIVLKEENKVVGSVSVEDVFTMHKNCEIGWSVNVNYQGKGIGYEAGRGLVDYIFTNLEIERIEVFIWEGNAASKKVAEKLGFKLEGVARKARIKDGQYFDVVQYGLLKEEWTSGKDAGGEK